MLFVCLKGEGILVLLKCERNHKGVVYLLLPFASHDTFLMNEDRKGFVKDDDDDDGGGECVPQKTGLASFHVAE